MCINVKKPDNSLAKGKKNYRFKITLRLMQLLVNINL